MTKEEIKALVAAKIAGQGSAIDAASVLPTILDAIVDAIPEVTPAPTPAEMLDALTLKSSLDLPVWGGSDMTKAEASELMGISEDDLDNLFSGAFLRIMFEDKFTTICYCDNYRVVFGFFSNNVAELGILDYNGISEYNLTFIEN